MGRDLCANIAQLTKEKIKEFLPVVGIFTALLNQLKTKKPSDFSEGFSWYQLESNQRHKDFQSFALPTEL